MGYVDRQAMKALGESLEVLTGQKGGRYHHRNLAPGHGGNESCTKCHFRLAEPNVAANQPIHRPPRRQIVKNRIDRRKLIVRFLVGESRRELVVDAFRCFHHRRGLESALSCCLDQAVGDFQNALLELGLTCLPGTATELVELGFLVFRAIAGQKLNVFNRKIEFVATGILKF